MEGEKKGSEDAEYRPEYCGWSAIFLVCSDP